MNSETTQCPVCGSMIPQEKLLQVQAELAEKNRRDLEARIAHIQKQAEADAARKAEQQLTLLRQRMEWDHQRALQRQRADLDRDRLQFRKKINEMERQLERKTANQLGDTAEIDLLETLRAEFPGDRVSRIGKGKVGADLVHEFIHKGQVCGRVLVESKNCQVWQNRFTSKLRRDQIEAKADHAILSTTAFPRGTIEQLCVEDGVIVVTPTAVPHILKLLRQAAIRIHSLGLSANQRSDKMNRLYAYITSKDYGQRFSEIRQMADGLIEIDAQERRQHEKTWGNRGGMITRMNHIYRGIDAEVGAIVEGPAALDAIPMAEAV